MTTACNCLQKRPNCVASCPVSREAALTRRECETCGYNPKAKFRGGCGMVARNEKDFYITPKSVIEKLLQNYEIKPGMILEPCAGNGAICLELRNIYDGTIDSVEIRPEERDTLTQYCDDVYIMDFLDFTNKHPGHYQTIITNPPFSIAEEIIRHCFKIAGPETEVIILLRLAFLESKKRKPFWKEHPLSGLIALSDRPSYTGRGTDNSAYGWFIWNHELQQFIKVA